MQDIHIETHISRQMRTSEKVMRIFLIVMTVFTFLIFALTAMLLFFLPFAAFGGLLWYYSMNAQLDFDYILTNQELDIAIIRGKSRRKILLTVDVGKELLTVAPSRTAPVQPWIGKRMKTYDCTSHTDAPYYCMIVKDVNDVEKKILFEPDEELLEGLWRYQPRKVFKTAEPVA